MTVRSILITGCSSGIGLDAARTLRARGWRVFATCRQEVDCDRLRGEGLESFRLDYADEASIADAVTEVVARTGIELLQAQSGSDQDPVRVIVQRAEAHLLAVDRDRLFPIDGLDQMAGVISTCMEFGRSEGHDEEKRQLQVHRS